MAATKARGEARGEAARGSGAWSQAAAGCPPKDGRGGRLWGALLRAVCAHPARPLPKPHRLTLQDNPRGVSTWSSSHGRPAAWRSTVRPPASAGAAHGRSQTSGDLGTAPLASLREKRSFPERGGSCPPARWVVVRRIWKQGTVVTGLAGLDVRGKAIGAGPDQHGLECSVRPQASSCSS